MEHHRKLVFSNRMPIRWGDEDAMGHVNNTVYFRYMEQTRIEWLESFGFGTSWTQTEGPVIVNASCTFLVPVHLSGHHRMPHVLRARRGAAACRPITKCAWSATDRIYAEGAAKLVWINPSTGKSIPLPDVMRASCL